MNKYFTVLALMILVGMSQARVLELETPQITINSAKFATEHSTEHQAYIAKRQLPCCSTYFRADTNCDHSC
jgi:hypothetical protein